MANRGIWEIPQGLAVLPDGTWRVGDLQVLHPATLRHLKSHLVFEPAGAFVVDGAQRMAVDVQGPPFTVLTLLLDARAGTARAVLDDGTEEELVPGGVGMSETTGRFECVVRDGRARAVLSRAAHEALLEHVEDQGHGFALRVGERSIPIRT
jgi:hypothetical protein